MLSYIHFFFALTFSCLATIRLPTVTHSKFMTQIFVVLVFISLLPILRISFSFVFRAEVSFEEKKSIYFHNFSICEVVSLSMSTFNIFLVVFFCFRWFSCLVHCMNYFLELHGIANVSQTNKNVMSFFLCCCVTVLRQFFVINENYFLYISSIEFHIKSDHDINSVLDIFEVCHRKIEHVNIKLHKIMRLFLKQLFSINFLLCCTVQFWIPKHFYFYRNKLHPFTNRKLQFYSVLLYTKVSINTCKTNLLTIFKPIFKVSIIHRLNIHF